MTVSLRFKAVKTRGETVKNREFSRRIRENGQKEKIQRKDAKKEGKTQRGYLKGSTETGFEESHLYYRCDSF